MNRFAKLVPVVILGLVTSACTPVVRELRHSGGYPGYLMDRRFFDASGSKELQLFRAGIIVAMASRVGATYVQDAEEAEAFLNYLEAASDELNFMAGHIYEIPGRTLCTDLSRVDCDAHSALFESDVPQLEERILRLVVAALPQRRAAAFLDSARGGDIMSAAWSALRLALDAVDGARRGAAVQRSTLELRALMVQASNRCAAPVASPVATVNRAVECLNIPIDELSAPNEVSMPTRVPPGAFNALFGIIRTSCGMLPVSSVLDEADETQQAAELRERRDDCGDIKFEPQLRFGGLRGFQGGR